MNLDKLLAKAKKRHQASRSARLASWLEMGGGEWAVLVTEASIKAGKTVITVLRVTTGTPAPALAAGIAAAQRRADAALTSAFGAAWEDAWHECALLSLACEAGAEMLLGCQARPRTAERILAELEESCLRVRSRIAAVSSEFPRLVAAVQGICHRPVALAA